MSLPPKDPDATTAPRVAPLRLVTTEVGPAPDNVTRLADVTDDARLWTVRDALEEALRDVIKAGEDAPNKAYILFLNDRDDGYRTSFVQAGMKTSEVLALLEVQAQHTRYALAPPPWEYG